MNKPKGELKIPVFGPPVAELVFDASREWLEGKVGDFTINEKVYSGGSRGHTILPKSREAETNKRATNYLYHEANELKSRLSTTGMKEVKLPGGKSRFVQRGGTLPPGRYTCRYTFNKNLGGECIFLDRASGVDGKVIHSPFASFPIPHNRTNSFFIHKFGPKGSDGCLVFPQATEPKRLALNQAIKKFPGLVVLRVINASYMLPAELGGYMA
jgi:hypothetical protein